MLVHGSKKRSVGAEYTTDKGPANMPTFLNVLTIAGIIVAVHVLALYAFVIFAHPDSLNGYEDLKEKDIHL